MSQDYNCSDRNHTKAQAPSRPCAVVLAMHRSGSSALAGYLASLGAALPRDLMARDANNEKGYFESNGVTALNDEIMAALGCDWSGLRRLDTDQLPTPINEEFTRRATDLICTQFPAADGQAVVLKDPRMCRLIGFWDGVLRSAGMVPTYVLSHRHPSEVAASLSRRNGFATEYSLLLWLRHALDAERGSRGRQRVHVSYAMLLHDPATVRKRVSGLLGLDEAARGQEEATDFLDRDLHHHVVAVGTEPSLASWVAQVFDVFTRWAQAGEVVEDYETLDAVRTALDESAGLWAGIVAEGEPWRLRYRKAILALETALETRDFAAPLPSGPLITAFEALLAQSVSAFEARHLASKAEYERIRIALSEERMRAERNYTRVTSAIFGETATVAGTSLAPKTEAFVDLDRILAEVATFHRERAQNRELCAVVAARESALAAREAELTQILRSRAWRATCFLRRLAQILRRAAAARTQQV